MSVPILHRLRPGPRSRADVGPPRAPWLTGPPPALPAALDRMLERWWWLAPRQRAAVLAVALALVAGGSVAQVARSPYGPPVAVVVAARDLPAGATALGATATARRPAGLVPSDAVATVPADATLTLGVVAGTVLTARHLQPGGPLAGLTAGAAAIAVPLDGIPGLLPGRRVDLVATRADGGGIVLATDARVLSADGDLVWLAVPRAAAPDVAAAAARGLLSAAVLPD